MFLRFLLVSGSILGNGLLPISIVYDTTVSLDTVGTRFQ